jgi:hypothetical protein
MYVYIYVYIYVYYEYILSLKKRGHRHIAMAIPCFVPSQGSPPWWRCTRRDRSSRPRQRFSPRTLIKDVIFVVVCGC